MQDVEDLEDASRCLSAKRIDAAIPKTGSMRSEKIEIPREKNAGISERAADASQLSFL